MTIVTFLPDNKFDADAEKLLDLFLEKKLTKKELADLDLTEMNADDISNDEIPSDFYPEELSVEVSTKNVAEVKLFSAFLTKLSSFFEPFIDAENNSLTMKQVKAFEKLHAYDKESKISVEYIDNKYARIYLYDYSTKSLLQYDKELTKLKAVK